MSFDPDRFVQAQAPVWDRVRAELAAGRKESHWMWFVFPQLAALGRSATAKHFGLDDLQAARAYLAHPVLGPRLIEAARLMLRHQGQPPEAVLGGIDAMKLRSSMTLFARVPVRAGAGRRPGLCQGSGGFPRRRRMPPDIDRNRL